MNQEEYKNEYYKEIDIIDYFKLLQKRKRLIFGVFLLFVIIVGLYSFFLIPNSKLYTLETTLEIGTVESSEGLRQIAVEEMPQVLEKIKGGFYGSYLGMKVENPEGTRLINIEIKTKSNTEDAKKIVDGINKGLLADHNSKIDYQKSIMQRKKDAFLETIENLKKDISSLFFQGQQIASLKLRIYELQLMINEIEERIDKFQPTKIIKEPIASEDSGAGRFRFLSILIIAGILGIFVGVILALGKEWWDKNKQRL